MKKIFQQFIQELQALWVMITGRFIKASFKRAPDNITIVWAEVVEASSEIKLTKFGAAK